jgi:hypothetical protein
MDDATINDINPAQHRTEVNIECSLMNMKNAAPTTHARHQINPACIPRIPRLQGRIPPFTP